MIDSAPVTRPGRSATVDEEFLALVCSDEEWLRAEFDAIIAVGWGSAQRSPPRPGSAAGPPKPSRRGRWSSTSDPSGRQRRTGIRARARQRSPPPLRDRGYDKDEGKVMPQPENPGGNARCAALILPVPARFRAGTAGGYGRTPAGPQVTEPAGR